MKPTGFRVFFLVFSCFAPSSIPPASGWPADQPTIKQVVAVAGKDVTLPCGSVSGSSCVMTVDWSLKRQDGSPKQTVYALRDGSILAKEQLRQYRGRTAITRDGSLTLLRVQRRDEDTYRCFINGDQPNAVSVSVIVAEASDVNLTIQRTLDNHLIVRCESSGWSPKPTISLLDSGGSELTAENHTSVRPDGLYFVSAHLKVTAAAAATPRNWTLICRVEIPGMNVSKETKISVTDEFKPSPKSEASCRHHVTGLVVSVIFIFVLLLIIFFRWKGPKLLQSLRARIHSLMCRTSEEPLLPGRSDPSESFGDINEVKPSGASDATARSYNLSSRGVEASEELAKRDLKKMNQFKETIIKVGVNLNVHPALIAGIISRQSAAGEKLGNDGYGQKDSNCFGLMQINKHYHAVKGSAYGWEHVDQGATYIIQLIKTMRREKQDWSKEQQLTGALACYVAGEEKIIPLEYDMIDTVTPNGDFVNDVMARAQWFAREGYNFEQFVVV